MLCEKVKGPIIGSQNIALAIGSYGARRGGSAACRDGGRSLRASR